MQEEELDSCRAAGERGPDTSGMRVQGETKAGSPCAILQEQKSERLQVRRPSQRFSLGRFFGLLAGGLDSFFALPFAASSCLTLDAMAYVSTMSGAYGKAQVFSPDRRSCRSLRPSTA